MKPDSKLEVLQTPRYAASDGTAPDQAYFTLRNVFHCIRRDKRTILAAVFLTSLATSITVLILPPTFKSTATLLPQQKSKLGSNALGDVLGSLVQTGGMSETVSETDKLSIFLKSRSVQEEVVSRLDLKKFLFPNKFDTAKNKWIEEPNIEDTLIAFDKIVDIGKDDIGLLGINVITHNPEMSSKINHTYLEVLEETMNDRNAGVATRNLQYINTQLEIAQIELKQAQDLFAQFQNDHAFVSMESQADVSMRFLADLEVEAKRKDIEIGVLSQEPNVYRSRISALKREKTTVTKEIERLKYAQKPPVPEGGAQPLASNVKPNQDVVKSITELTDLSKQYLELQRSLLVQSKVVETLIQQREVTRLEGGMGTAMFQVVDKGATPNKRHTPKRTKSVVIAFILSLLLAVLVSLFRDLVTRNIREALA